MDINVCFATNNNYAPHAAALVASIMQNKLPEDDMFFHFFSDRVTFEIQKSFHQMSQTMGFKLAIYEMSDEQFADFPLFMGSRTTYFRLSMQKLLPKSVKKILYLDCDMIVMSSLQELYSTDIFEHYAAVVAEASRVPHLPINYPYFNGGMILFNLEKYRIANLEEDAMRFGYEHRDWMRFADQEILNYIFNGNVVYLPPKWNAIGMAHMETIIREFSYEIYPYSDKEILEAETKPKIVHYVTNSKPWLPVCKHPHKAFYWKYVRKTPFYEQVWDDYRKKAMLNK